MKLLATIPIRTLSALNSREHWRARAKRVRDERWVTHVMLSEFDGQKPLLPCAIRLTRVGPTSGLDPFDNLPSALKGIADAVAAWLGVDDKNPDVLRFVPHQERGKAWAVRVELVE